MEPRPRPVMAPPDGRSAREELRPIAARIERLVLAPHEVRDALGWIAAPLLRVLGYRAELSTERLRALLEAVGRADTPAAELASRLADAIDELEDNVDRTERACVVHGRPPLGHPTWLWRILELIGRASRPIEGGPAGGRALSNPDAILLVPPPEGRAEALARVDLLLAIAREEPEMLGRRRALLQAARAALLDAAASLALTKDAVGPRAAYLATEIEAIDRLEAAGVDPRRGLLHQARSAHRRGERGRLRACLVAVDAVARRRGDGRLATLAATALERCGGDPLSATPDRARQSMLRSAEETFGVPLLERVRDGIARGREEAAAAIGGETDARRRRSLERAEAYLGEAAEAELLSAALAVDGWFDVGGAATPVRVVEEERRMRLVRHPAPKLVVVPATRIEDLRDAILTDPRALTFQLAEGTLLTRRFVAEEVKRTTRSRLSTELRIYVADGSSSMLGPRARMRDALLVAELATLVSRLRQPRRFLSPVLELRFFDRELGPLERVSTVDEALGAIAGIFASPRRGGTDIEGALIGSFEQVRRRASEDASLARAQIVLISDGMAPIDRAKVRAARDASGELPIRLSIVALGRENAALRELAAEQRARGEGVFYHHVPDEDLARICDGDLERRVIVHAPSGEDPVDAPDDALAELLAEMEAAARSRDAERRARADGTTSLDAERARELTDAASELDLGLEDLFADGARARIEVLERDARALSQRFDRWFPSRPSSAAPDPLPGSPERERVDLACVLVASTAEIVDQVGGREAERRADAIAIFERLLFEHGLPPWTYAAVLRDHGGCLEADLRALRSVVHAAA